MTSDEQKQYNSLSYEERQDYDDIRQRRPHWSHKQIMVKIALEREIDKIPGTGPTDPTGDPEILRGILKGVKEFLTEVGCFVWDVFEAIDDAIDTLTDLIASGLSYIGNKLSEFWEWLTS